MAIWNIHLSETQIWLSCKLDGGLAIPGQRGFQVWQWYSLRLPFCWYECFLIVFWLLNILSFDHNTFKLKSIQDMITNNIYQRFNWAFSDHLLSFVRQSLRPSVNIAHFYFFFRTTVQSLTKIVKKTFLWDRDSKLLK